jgi:formate-dependent nitrite reductase cytochrome c552 subunit
LFAAEGNLDRPSQASVTCATCHLPRQEVGESVTVNHNNTYTLLPRDRMVKEVCMNCHGLEYSYNSIFDDQLVEDNFSRSPSQELETFQLIRSFEERRSGG